jgi:hypothetical protein
MFDQLRGNSEIMRARCAEKGVWEYGVVPFTVEVVLLEGHCFQFLVRHLDPRFIGAGIQFGLDP